MKREKRTRRLIPALLALLLLAAGCRAPIEDGTLNTGGNEGSPLPQSDSTPLSTAVPTPGPDDARLLKNAEIAPGVAEADAIIVLRALAAENGGADYVAWLEADGRKVYVYRSVEFAGNTLVLAMEPLDGEAAPELFCVRDGGVEYRTRGSDCRSVNYTRLPGATIVYGSHFANETGSTSVAATFIDGRRVEQALVRAPGEQAPLTEGSGYIIVSESDTYLASLVIYNGETPVADDGDGCFSMLGDELNSWAGTPRAVWGRVRFCPSLASAYCTDESEALLDEAASGLEDAALMRVSLDGAARTEPDLWRCNNAAYYTADLPANAVIPIRGLPDEITEVYFVEPALDTDADGFEAAVTETALAGEAFSLAGFAPGARVTLVIKTPNFAYLLPIRVV